MAVIMSSSGWRRRCCDLIDVVGDREVLGLLGLRRQPFLALFAVKADVAPFPELVVVLLREPQQGRDHHYRQAHPEVLDEIEPARADERIEVLATQLPDAILEGGDAPGRVSPADNLPEGVVEQGDPS